MRRLGIIFGAYFIAVITVCAQNIVPNSSFEEYENCPTSVSDFSITNWFIPKYSPDYYNSCATFMVGVPDNWGGGGYAHNGDGYVGISLFSLSTNNYREFFSAKLTQLLIPGKKYNIEFYMTLMDSMWYATKNIGMYFSADSIEEQMSSNFFFSIVPQIKYTGIDYLTDKEGWMKVEGNFYADGGEQFITIGNFDDDEHIDTLFVGGATGGILDKRKSYYYIDDVSVELDTLTGLEEYENMKFEIYPNPAKESIVIETDISEQTAVRLFDVTAREVLTTTLAADKTTLDMSGFAAGVYTAVLLRDDVAVGRKKIIVE